MYTLLFICYTSISFIYFCFSRNYFLSASKKGNSFSTTTTTTTSCASSFFCFFCSFPDIVAAHQLYNHNELRFVIRSSCSIWVRDESNIESNRISSRPSPGGAVVITIDNVSIIEIGRSRLGAERLPSLLFFYLLPLRPTISKFNNSSGM
jgi:hypothetical protein